MLKASSPPTHEPSTQEASPLSHNDPVLDLKSSFSGSFQDSFDPYPSQKSNSQKVLQVASSKKNTAGDLTASFTSSSGTLAKHGSQVLKGSHAMLASGIIAPMGIAIGSTISLAKDAHTEDIVTYRLERAQFLLNYCCETFLIDKLSSINFESQLKHFHEEPSLHDLSAVEVMLQTLKFAIFKMQRRISRLQIQQRGSQIALVGAGLTGAGLAGAGFGAIPGIIVAGTGSAINLAPTVQMTARAAQKRADGTKGVIRKSSALFIWGFALRKIISEKIVPKHALKESDEAELAHILAEQWPYLRPKEDVLAAQEIAYEFLKQVGIIKDGVIPENFTGLQALEKIESRLKSTPNV